MMRCSALLLSSLLALTSACAHGRACQPPDLAWIAEETAALPARGDLVHVLQMFFESHCTCVLSPELKERVTYGAGKTGAGHDHHGEACLGAVEIVNKNLRDGFVGYLEVKPVGMREKEGAGGLFLVIVVYSGERWLVYPAAPVLAKLH